MLHAIITSMEYISAKSIYDLIDDRQLYLLGTGENKNE